MTRLSPPGPLRGPGAWLFATIAMLPMLAIYALHFTLTPDGARGSGFLQGDQPMYMAMARRYFDGGFFPLYGLPYSPFEDTPRIYLQLLMLGMGTVMWLFQLDPGHVYVGTGIVAGVIMLRLALALLDAFCPGLRGASGILTRVAFLWGGGAFTLAALAWVLLTGRSLGYWTLRDDIVAFDPTDGYWFLNLGRNVFYTTEAAYHCLFFATILFLQRQRYGWTLLLLGLTVATHPFTALELGLIICAFAYAERVIWRQYLPIWFLAGATAAVVILVLYYAVLLSHWSPEHASVLRQHTEGATEWTFRIHWYSMAAGYIPVGALAAWRLWRDGALRKLPDWRDCRLLLVWFAVAFGLINHDLIVAPRQPAHFTRGYVWIPLALLAIPLVRDGIARILAWRSSLLALTGSLTVMGFVLLDNTVWFGRAYVDMAMVRRFGTAQHIPSDRDTIFALLNTPSIRGRLIISNDEWVGYLASTYSPVRVWESHTHATPYYSDRRREVATFLATGAEPAEWARRDMIVAIRRATAEPGSRERILAAGFREREPIGRYDILLRDAGATVRR